MARVVRTAPEVVLGSKSVAPGTYPGSPATCFVDWAGSGGLIPGGAACAWFSVHGGCSLDRVKALLYALTSILGID